MLYAISSPTTASLSTTVLSLILFRIRGAEYRSTRAGTYGEKLKTLCIDAIHIFYEALQACLKETHPGSMVNRSQLDESYRFAHSISAKRALLKVLIHIF